MMKKNFILCIAMTMLTGCVTAQDIQLPEPDKSAKMTLMEALQQRASSREFSDKEVSDAVLSQVLWAACGINRPGEKKITAPSAINAQDILVYVARKDGAYLYQPETNTLKKVCDEDVRKMVAGQQEFAATAPISLILVSDNTKFGDRSSGADLMGNIDSGYVSENICLVCTALGLKTVPRMSMDKEALAMALKLTDSQVLLLNNPIGW
jgi:nitroreductase